MRVFYLTITFFLAVFFCLTALGQQTQKPATPSSEARASSAYAEILLRRTEHESDLESLLLDYTDEFPRVKELKFSLSLIQKEAAGLLLIKPADSSKLTLALGRLIVRKIELETDVWRLRQSYADGHPEVKRARRKVEIFEKAIREILG